jgi:hypothetical protein
MADDKKAKPKPSLDELIAAQKKKYADRIAPTVPTGGDTGPGLMEWITGAGKAIAAPAVRTYDQANAALTGAAMGATMGGAPSFMAAMEATGNPTMGLMNMITKLGTGEAMIDDKQERTDYDAAIAKYPLTGLAGQIGGSILPGAAAVKGVKSAVQVAPLLGKANSLLSRIAAAAGYGGGEAAVQARFGGGDVMTSAMQGAAAGGLGQTLLGELGPNAYRAIAGSDAGKDAAAYLRTIMDEGSGGRADPATIRQTVRDIGPDAMLLDHPAALPAATQLLADPNTVGGTGPLRREALDRIDPASVTNVRVKFADTVKDWVPDSFRTTDLGGDEARRLTRMLGEVSETQKALQPRYNDILDNGQQLFFTDRTIKPLVDDILLPNGPINSKEDFQAAHDWLTGRMTVLSEGGKRPYQNRAVHTMISELRDKAQKIYAKTELSPPEKFLAGKYTELANAIEENTLNRIPEYVELQSKYKTVENYKSAYGLGMGLFKAKPDDLDVLPDRLSALPPAAHPAFFEGMTAAFSDALESKTATTAVLTKLSQSPGFNVALRTVLPDASADAIRLAADQAVALGQNAQKMATAGNNASRFLSGKSREARSVFNHLVIGSFFSKLIGLGGASTVGTIGATKQEIVNDLLTPQIAKLAGGALTTKGEAGGGLSSILDQIYNQGKLTSPADTMLLNQITDPAAMARNPAMMGIVAGGTVGGALQQSPGARERRQ